MRLYKGFAFFILGLLSFLPFYSFGFQANGVKTNNNLLSSPRHAVHTFSFWQQPGHENFDKAILPFKLSDGTKEDKIDLAEKLKKILDARGLLIDYDKIPNEPNYEDSLSELQQYTLFSQLPEIYVTKINGEWVFSEATIQKIPVLYRAVFSGFISSIIDQFPDWAKNTWLGIYIWQYIALFLWLLVGLVLKRIFEFIINNVIRRIIRKTSFSWDDDLLDSIENPAGFIFLIAYFIASYSNLQFSVTVNHYLSGILQISISVGVIWLFYNLSDVFTKYLQVITARTDNKLDDQLVPLIRKTLRFFIVVMGVIIMFQNMGYNVASIIAGLGIGGLAVALAAKDTLANFFGSVTIFIDKPFRIGDYIYVNDIAGTVEDVGFRSTRIRTFYDSLVSVPNSKIADSNIDNRGVRRYRQMKTYLNLTYSTTPEQMEAFVEGIKAIIKANKYIRKDLYEVHFNEFGAHSLNVLVYVFFAVSDWSNELQQRHNFLLEIMRLAADIGVDFAFPTQTLHVDSFQREKAQNDDELTEDELSSIVYEFGPDGERARPDGIKLYKNGKEIDFGSNT